MAKRKSRGFGSSAAEHLQRADVDARAAKASADDAIHDASGGRCRSALTFMADAYRRLGSREAERRGAGHVGAENTHIEVDRARRAVLDHCIIKR